MRYKILKWLCAFNFIYRFSVSIIANRIVHSNDYLKPDHLLSNGWIEENGFFVEPNVKERDKIWIRFEAHYFRVYHGENRTFISLESKKEWFDNYYILSHGDNGIYKLSGI